jgi:uncharacterized protein YndB with AHSA1/START domain
MSVIHATFSLEREYAAAPERVFAAWSDPAAKARWFAGDGAEHRLDFRVGGTEAIRAPGPDGQVLTVESLYRDIVPGERIVYCSTLSADDRVATVSTTTVEFAEAGDGTRLLLTEQGVFLDGLEEPAWREQGTSDWLDGLATEVEKS